MKEYTIKISGLSTGGFVFTPVSCVELTSTALFKDSRVAMDAEGIAKELIAYLVKDRMATK